MQVESTDFHVHRNVMASVSPHLMELFSAEQVRTRSSLITAQFMSKGRTNYYNKSSCVSFIY